MDNDIHMRGLVETVLPNFCTHLPVKTVSSDLSYPFHQHTPAFFQNLMTVLDVKRILIYNRWETFCASSCFNALSTHEMYLRYVMFACENEVRFSSNIFEKVLAACALVVNFNIETLINSGVDFCEMSVDMFMAFYKIFLQELFYGQGGFEEFIEYLGHHEYLPWEFYKRNQEDIHGKYSFLKMLYEETEKHNENSPYHPKIVKHNDVEENDYSKYLAYEVLQTTKIKLPILTNPADLEVRLCAASQQKARIRAEVSKRELTTQYAHSEPTENVSKRKGLKAALKPKKTDSSSRQISLAGTSSETSEIHLQESTSMNFETQLNTSGMQNLHPAWCQQHLVGNFAVNLSIVLDTNNQILYQL